VGGGGGVGWGGGGGGVWEGECFFFVMGGVGVGGWVGFFGLFGGVDMFWEGGERRGVGLVLDGCFGGRPAVADRGPTRPLFPLVVWECPFGLQQAVYGKGMVGPPCRPPFLNSARHKQRSVEGYHGILEPCRSNPPVGGKQGARALWEINDWLRGKGNRVIRLARTLAARWGGCQCGIPAGVLRKGNVAGEKHAQVTGGNICAKET